MIHKTLCDDIDLVKRAQSRDASAFTTLMEKQMTTLYKTARAILHHDEDAADAIQETLLACWKNISTLKRPEYFRTWMTRILIGKCSDLIRRNHDTVNLAEWTEVPAPEQGYDSAEWKATLSLLEERYRIVLVLYYVDGCKTSEIADILGLSETAVRSRLSRGREKLRTHLRDEHEETPPHQFDTGFTEFTRSTPSVESAAFTVQSCQKGGVYR